MKWMGASAGSLLAVLLDARGAQSGQTSDNVNQQGAGPKEGAEKASDNTKDSLSSNPQHTLEKHAEETTSKKV